MKSSASSILTYDQSPTKSTSSLPNNSMLPLSRQCSRTDGFFVPFGIAFALANILIQKYFCGISFLTCDDR
jgi:hypothetical protein